ncbi:unnamed protein product [Candidula unifasciata]|uniref:G-protein coupled receptors family 1 profile domain-containing protein n=1 Tax=Candidula unifasciata TaxID=100452 RepID=A0A8S3YTQ6_9EUPU|nr:unnamed protein product [Candidula unifasciata]
MELTNFTEASNATAADDWSVAMKNGLDRSITPVLYVVGFPGNIISFTIWLQKRMRHSSGYYLAALALDDLIFLVLHLVYELHTAWHVTLLDYPFVCEAYTIIFLATQFLSPFLVLAFTTERYISICHPFKRETFCTIRRAKIVIICLCISMPFLTAINGYFWYLTDTKGCTTRPEVTQGESRSLYNIYSTTVDMLAFVIVPVAVLVLNILVIREMRRLSRVEQTQLHGSSQRTGSTTVMLLAVSFYQIITTLPVTIAYAVYLEFSCEGPLPECSEGNKIYALVLTVIREYGITHYAFNIFIYVITGKMFREELKKLLMRPCAKLASSFPTLPTDYASLRTSVRGSDRSKTWVSVNGNHNNDRIPNETLL